MGRFRTFHALNGPPGSDFTRIVDVKEYKARAKRDDTAIGKGICTAMAIRWIQNGTVPTTDEQFQELATLQKVYLDASKGKKSNFLAVAEVAKQCGLYLALSTPDGEQDEAIEKWKKNTFGAAVSKYVDGGFTSDERRLPCVILLNMHVPSADVNGEPYPEDLSDGHIVALKRVGDSYQYFDPNAGVYEVCESAIETFFDTVYQCYKDFHNKSDVEPGLSKLEMRLSQVDDAKLDEDDRKEKKTYEDFVASMNSKKSRGETLTLNADVDLQLVRCYAIQ